MTAENMGRDTKDVQQDGFPSDVNQLPYKIVLFFLLW